MQVSPGAADLLTFLGEQLLILQDQLSAVIFSAVMEKVNKQLDDLLLMEVSHTLSTELAITWPCSLASLTSSFATPI